MKHKKILLSLIIFILCILGYTFYLYMSKNFSNPYNKLSSNENIPTTNSEDINTDDDVTKYDLSFAVFGDIHDNETDFQDAIDDIKSTDVLLDALVLNGDTVDQGIDSQYETITSVLDNNKDKLPDKIIKNIGNHEFYNYENSNKSGEDVNEKIQKYLNFAHEEKVYHDTWINGYHFISLGSEDGNSLTCNATTAYISNEQIKWLKEKLAENYEKGRPIFIFLHQPIVLNWGWGDINGTNVSPELNNILSQYPESILFNSHTHKQMSDECLNTANNYTAAQTGAISYTLFINSDSTLSRDYSYINGLYITVSGNDVTIRGRDLKNHNWIFSKDLTSEK